MHLMILHSARSTSFVFIALHLHALLSGRQVIASVVTHAPSSSLQPVRSELTKFKSLQVQRE